MQINKNLPSESFLDDFAHTVAANLETPLVIYLNGPLGAGKTTFVRSLIRALGYPGRVKSPTYGLLERYEINDIYAVHLDLYRVAHEGELEFLALRDLFDDATVWLIEWPEKGGGEIPPADVVISFADSVIDRALTAKSVSGRGDSLLSAISG